MVSRSRQRVRGALVGAALAVLSGAQAQATTLKMWGATQFGFGSASVSAAQSAGVGSLPDSSFCFDPLCDIDVSTPPSIPGTNVAHASFANPSTGSSTWTVTANDRAYQDLWIVIQGHDPNDPNASYYDNEKIGLVIDPTDSRWKLVHPAGFTQYTYLAFFVGDLALGASADVPISYVVAQALKVVSSNPTLYVFPQYRVNFLELAVPEPVVLSMLAFAGLALAIRNRRATG